MLRTHGLGEGAYLYKGTSVFWNLDIDNNVKEAEDPNYDKEFFELNWGMPPFSTHNIC